MPRRISTPSEPAFSVLRGRKVVLDSDLAPLYRVSVSRLHAVLRRSDRPPKDFVFRLNARERRQVRSERGVDSGFAVTPAGVAWLSAQVASPEARQMTITVVRDFDRLRRQLYTYADLGRKVEALSQRCSRRDEDLRYLLSFVQGLLPQA